MRETFFNKTYIEGLVLPVELIVDLDLSYTDIIVFSLIKSIEGKDGCVITSPYIAEVLWRFDRQTARNSIKKLTSKGYIVEENGKVKTNPDFKKITQEFRVAFQEKIEKTEAVKNYGSAAVKNYGDLVTNIYINNSEDKDESSQVLKQSSKELCNDKSEGMDGEEVLRRMKTKTKILMGIEAQESHETKTVEITEPIKKIIDCWTANGFRKTRSSSKTFSKIVRSLKRLRAGRFFNSTNPNYKDRRFTDEEIIQTIQRFALAAFHKDYEPREGEYKDRLRKTNLLQFLYNGFVTNEENKSLFIKYFENSPKMLRQTPTVSENSNPVITRIFKKWFVRHVTGVQVSFSNIDERNFQEGGTKLLQFLKKHRANMADGMAISESEFAKVFCKSILAASGDQPEKISTKWFCSDFTFNKRLPAYLNSQGFFTESYSGSPIYDDDVKIGIYDE